MPRTIAYVRVSTDKQELLNQRFEIERFCRVRGFVVDLWNEEIVSGTIKVKDRKVGTMLEQLQPGDRLIVSEISRISRSLSTILNVIEGASARGVAIVSVKENMSFGDDLNSKIIAAGFGMAAEIERSLISARTKEALARKRAEGMRLGRPPGSTRLEHYKLHGKDERILRYMARQVSIAAIARLLNVNVKTLRNYIELRDLRRQLKWREVTETGV